MLNYTKAQINNILNLKGWLNTQIDVFNLYAVLTIGVSNRPGEWEISQKTYLENKLPITLEVFENCKTEVDVKKAFTKAMKHAVNRMLFNGSNSFNGFEDEQDA